MPSLVDQIFEQARAGSAQGASLAQPLEAGVQAGQAQQRINLATRQLAQQWAQQQVEMQFRQGQNTLQSFQIQQQQRAQNNYIASTQAFGDLSAKISPLLQNGQLDEARQLATSAAVGNNMLLMDPRYVQLDKSIDEMQRRKTDLMYRTQLGQARLGMVDARTLAAMPEPARYKTLARQADAEGDTELSDFYNQKADETAKSHLPIIMDFDGHKRLVNPKSGHSEPLDKTPSKSDFIAKNAAKYVTDTGVNLNEAADALGRFYDEKLAPLGAAPSAPAAAPAPSTTDPLGILKRR